MRDLELTWVARTPAQVGRERAAEARVQGDHRQDQACQKTGGQVHGPSPAGKKRTHTPFLGGIAEP